MDDVTLSVRAGTVCGIVGPSGAGKSTLARCMALLERPDRGAIRVDGTDIVPLDGHRLRAARRRIGVVPQGNSLLRQRTIAGNIALPLEAARVPGPDRRKRVGDLLDLVGLTHKAGTYPDQLSGGQRQRVAVAKVLASNPSVLLTDEPTAALDPENAGSVLAVLDRVRAELGVAVFMATHDVSAVRRICDDVTVLDRGRVVESGRLLDLVSDQDSRMSSLLLPDVDQVGEPQVSHDRTADLVLVGFAAVGALMPEAARRFGVELAVLGGGLTRIADTPVARFRVGFNGRGADEALVWLAQRGAALRRVTSVVPVAAA